MTKIILKILGLAFCCIFIYSCKKYNCECVTEELVRTPTGNEPTYSNKTIKAINKSSASKKCNKNDYHGSYGDVLINCEIK